MKQLVHPCGKIGRFGFFRGLPDLQELPHPGRKILTEWGR